MPGPDKPVTLTPDKPTPPTPKPEVPTSKPDKPKPDITRETPPGTPKDLPKDHGKLIEAVKIIEDDEMKTFRLELTKHHKNPKSDDEVPAVHAGPKIKAQDDYDNALREYKARFVTNV